jgi:hypothetical protein
MVAQLSHHWKQFSPIQRGELRLARKNSPLKSAFRGPPVEKPERRISVKSPFRYIQRSALECPTTRRRRAVRLSKKGRSNSGEGKHAGGRLG